MESTASRFLALADELIIDIISQIQDRQSLSALARTCSRLQDLTEDFIFDSLLIRNGDRARVLARLFASGRIRPRAVHDLQIRWPHSVEDGIEDIGSVLKDFSQLRSLRIESPCCNDSPWIEQPEKPALPWTSGSRLDISGLFEIALSQSRSLEAPLLGQLQSRTSFHQWNLWRSNRQNFGPVVTSTLAVGLWRRSNLLDIFRLKFRSDGYSKHSMIYHKQHIDLGYSKQARFLAA